MNTQIACRSPKTLIIFHLLLFAVQIDEVRGFSTWDGDRDGHEYRLLLNVAVDGTKKVAFFHHNKFEIDNQKQDLANTNVCLDYTGDGFRPKWLPAATNALEWTEGRSNDLTAPVPIEGYERFEKSALEGFLKSHGLTLFVRGHSLVFGGVQHLFRGRCLTLHSTERMEALAVALFDCWAGDVSYKIFLPDSVQVAHGEDWYKPDDASENPRVQNNFCMQWEQSGDATPMLSRYWINVCASNLYHGTRNMRWDWDEAVRWVECILHRVNGTSINENTYIFRFDWPATDLTSPHKLLEHYQKIESALPSPHSPATVNHQEQVKEIISWLEGEIPNWFF